MSDYISMRKKNGEIITAIIDANKCITMNNNTFKSIHDWFNFCNDIIPQLKRNPTFDELLEDVDQKNKNYDVIQNDIAKSNIDFDWFLDFDPS